MEKLVAKKMTKDDFKQYVETVMFSTITNKTGVTNEDILNNIENIHKNKLLDIAPDFCWTKETMIFGDYCPLIPLDPIDKYGFPYCFSLEYFFPNVIEDLKNTNIDFGFSKIQLCAFDEVAHTKPMYYEKNGVCVIPCCAWEDKEFPICFVLYVDKNNQLRAYIPTNGNNYCKEYNCSYSRVWEYTEGILPQEKIDEIESKGCDGYNLEILLNDVFSNIVSE